MSRSKSLLSTVVLLLGVVATLALCVHGVQVWQSEELADGAASTDSAAPSGEDGKPVQLWHEDPQAKPIPTSAAPNAADDSVTDLAEPSRAADPRFTWAITPKETAAGEAESESPAAPAELDPQNATAADDADPAVPAPPAPRMLVAAANEQDAVVAASEQLPPATDAAAPTDAPPVSDAVAASPAAETPAADEAVAPAQPEGVAALAANPAEPAEAAEQAPAEEAPAEPQRSTVRVKVGRTSRTDGAPEGAGPTTIQEAPVVEGLEATRAWPQSQALRTILTSLAADPDGNAWASQVATALEKLETASSFQSPEAAASLQQLRALSNTVRQQVSAEETTPLHAKLLRANYALQRRLALWQAIYAAGTPKEAAPVNRQELAAATSAVDAFLAASGRQQEWRKFLLMEDVVAAIRSPNETASTSGRALARCILARLDSTLLTPQQAKFLDRSEVHTWVKVLQHWAAEPVDPVTLLKAVERYEARPTSAAARDMARANQVLRWATEEKAIDVGTQLNLHYRNANVRVAVSGDLANRLLPPLRRFNAPVDDVIRNTRVVGHSQTAARSRIVLFPDRTRWSLGLDVLGAVASETQGQRGPAVFFQDGQARFHARKLIHVDHQGVHTQPAFAVAESSSQLTGLETDFDGVPLMNRLARSIAQKQYEGEAGAAQSEVEERIADEASQRLDEESQQLLTETRKDFDARVLRPLAELGLEPTPIDFETTRQRLITRYRLAGSHQLAAHSPRPQAPSNSLLSIQVHESALNNIVEQLRFDGREVELPTLIQELAGRLGQKKVQIPEDLPENVRVHFANEDAVRLAMDGGRVSITLQVTELSQGRDNRWKNFVVRAYYIPQIAGRQVSLVRDGVIELGGDRRRIGDQVALRGIFAKVLSKNRPITLLPTSLVDRRELADVEASQAVVEDGWIGITLAQGGSVARQRSTTQPQR